VRRDPTFIDSSGWIALIDVSDGLHGRAGDFWRTALEEGRRFLTSDYVLDETYTLLRRRRNGLKMASAVHEMVEVSRFVALAGVDEDLRRQAWEIFVGYEDKVLSYTDCTSFALMRERKLLEVFSFDGDFERAGFIVRPA